MSSGMCYLFLAGLAQASVVFVANHDYSPAASGFFLKKTRPSFLCTGWDNYRCCAERQTKKPKGRDMSGTDNAPCCSFSTIVCCFMRNACVLFVMFLFFNVSWNVFFPKFI